MKQLYLAFSFIAFLALNNGFAQNGLYYYQEVKTWEFGPRIGFTTSIINSKGEPNLESGIKMGIVGGIFARYQLADQWALNGNLSFSTRGNKSASANIENGYVDFSVVPLRNVKYRMFNIDHTFDFFVGPGVSILTGSQDKSANIPDLKNNLTDIEYNIVIGAGLPFGPFLLTATTRIGVYNLIESPLQGSKWHSISTEWTAAYRFK
jgi:Outer membrane protein beta-barrel domain